MRSSWLNAPNIVTLSRLILAGALFVLIDRGYSWTAATVVFVIAAATDALDGYLARRYGLVTTLGRILDPFVDKIIVCGSFVFLLAHAPKSGVNAWMVLVILARELFITSLRGYLERQGRDFSAAWSGKVKMVVQCLAVGFALLSMEPSVRLSGLLALRDALLWGAVAITIYSGIDYCIRAARMMKPETE
ncbi:MAG: CDP-diacylglycerol--glycerol-3-phosphate 3-phosphatidyltransferase [Planctomycetota bacterium]|nr:MAG: CDP-diacylglycerol--glycerol-3-phosphate 3-phosphatidyltransferase [Planctomycetota bacterium]